MSECVYPCGWKKLKSILIKESSFFAIETLDDSVSDGVRKCGISMGNRARDLADYAEKQQQRITDLEQQLKPAKPKLYRHIKTGGIYEFIADAEMESNLEDVVVYQSVEHKTVWVRPSSEFYDGRFEEYANNLEGK